MPSKGGAVAFPDGICILAGILMAVRADVTGVGLIISRGRG
ncbi:MAG: hypothetical protein ACE5I8_09275 [Thermodesulfobacteriota bacterium]